MYQKVLRLIESGLRRKIPGTGLGVFRICFGLVIIQEIVFLFYFRHLIFDPIPYIDSTTPWIEIALISWGIVALLLTVGLNTRANAIINYTFWVAFLMFTPMWHDFDGGFDQLMTSTSFLLIFLPAGNSLSLDNLKSTLRNANKDIAFTRTKDVPILCYYAPLAISLGLLYFDAALHKLSSEFWINGLGAWLPSTMPYYVSALDMSWLLNIKWLQMAIGYSLIIFQYCFIFLCYFKPFRIPLLIIGCLFHIGIIVSLNIYPFGLGMLVHYVLLTPVSWWKCLKQTSSVRSSDLWLYYDPRYKFARQFAIVANHFDFLNTLNLSTFEASSVNPQTHQFGAQVAKNNYYFVQNKNGIKYTGFQAFVTILFNMRYTAAFGLLFKIPLISYLAKYLYNLLEQRALNLPNASSRNQVNDLIETRTRSKQSDLTNPANTHLQARWILKLISIILLLQLNCSIYYGIFYRLGLDTRTTPLTRVMTNLSNITTSVSHVLLGITPHALYMDEHFTGYERILAIAYISEDGQEKWLPFVNKQGRIISPNWGRVHSMWANVAVRPVLNEKRLFKFIRKVTAFLAPKEGINLSNSVFLIKMKQIIVSMTWRHDLRNQNLTGQWTNIGHANWNDYRMQLDIPKKFFGPQIE